MEVIGERPMVAQDLGRVLALERAIFPVPWSEQMFTEELAGPGRSYVVAVIGAEVVGYGGIMVIDADAHIMTLGVEAAFRRRGIATALLLRLIDVALSRGAQHLTLELRVSNQAALQLYEKFGFAPVGVRPKYYIDEDALVMWAVDVNRPEYLSALDQIRQEAA